MKKGTIAALILLLIMTTAAFFTGIYVEKRNSKIEKVYVNNTDTIYKTDTLKILKILSLSIRRKLDTDTINPYVASENKANRIRADSNDSTRFIIPITRSTYKTEEYKAVIEGYKPTLVSLAVYPKTILIKNTQEIYRKPRFALTIGAGLGC